MNKVNQYFNFSINLIKRYYLYIFIFFILITLLFLIKHVPWRDEAQSWLLIRDLNFRDLINILPYEGHPPLWFFILYPFIKIGLPFSFEIIINYVISVTSIIFLFFYAPFPKITRILLIFNYYFLFEYTIIARNYSIAILLLFLIAYIYKKRFIFPLIYSVLILLLSLSNIHLLGLSFVIGIFFIFDLFKLKFNNIKYKFSLLLILISFFTTPFLLYPKSNSQAFGYLESGFNILGKVFTKSILPFVNLNELLSLAFLIFWVILLFFLIKDNKFILMLLFSWVWSSYIFIFKHPGFLRHFGLMLVFFIFFWWLSFDSFNLKNKIYKKSLLILNIILFLSLVGSFNFYFNNFNKKFSGSMELLSYINNNKNILIDPLTAYPYYIGISILPYLPDLKLYELEGGRLSTFVLWDEKYNLGSKTNLNILLDRMFLFYNNKINSFIILTQAPINYYNLDSKYKYNLLFVNTLPVTTDEFFYLYRIYKIN